MVNLVKMNNLLVEEVGVGLHNMRTHRMRFPRINPRLHFFHLDCALSLSHISGSNAMNLFERMYLLVDAPSADGAVSNR